MIGYIANDLGALCLDLSSSDDLIAVGVKTFDHLEERHHLAAQQQPRLGTADLNARAAERIGVEPESREGQRGERQHGLLAIPQDAALVDRMDHEVIEDLALRVRSHGPSPGENVEKHVGRQLQHMFVGIGMMVYPYFLTDPLWMILVACGLIAGLRFATR